jgi:integrase
VSEALSAYLSVFVEGLIGQSATNRRNYRQRLAPFLETYGHKSIDELTRGDVNAWLATLKGRGYARATRAGYQQALKKFLKEAARAAGVVSPAAHVTVEKFMGREPKAPPEADVQAALALAWRWLWQPLRKEKPDAGELRRVLDGAVYVLSLETGARRGELVSLRRSDVVAALRAPDEHGVYTVLAEGKRGVVDLEFTDVAAAALSRWLAVRPPVRVDRLFTTSRKSRAANSTAAARYRALTPEQMTDCFYRLCDAAGVPRHTSHPLRHRLGHLITAQYNARLAAIKLNHADKDSGATALAFYYHPEAEQASEITVTMRPAVGVLLPAQERAEKASPKER